VIDAGALDSSEDYPALCVLTPHAAEFARLQERIFGPIKGDELQGAAVLAKHLQVTILLKGSITRVFSPAGQVWELPAGPAWLATAGTGDVLAGIAGALCAAWRTKLESAPETLGELAAAAALLHALAAWEASRARGSGPITAGDVAEHVAPVVGRLLLSKT
jgi:NAD(P)H-hydrate repair Nnr-like enzyme with NAD(P)H-hydrate dehydratase domain